MEAKVTGITEGELDEIESGKTYVVDKWHGQNQWKVPCYMKMKIITL